MNSSGQQAPQQPVAPLPSDPCSYWRMIPVGCGKCRMAYELRVRKSAQHRSPPIPSHPHLAPIIADDMRKRPANSFCRHPASPLVRPGPCGLASGEGKVERNPAAGRHPITGW